MSATAERGFWDDRRVLVTGGAGFPGARLVDGLKARGCRLALRKGGAQR